MQFTVFRSTISSLTSKLSRLQQHLAQSPALKKKIHEFRLWRVILKAESRHLRITHRRSLRRQTKKGLIGRSYPLSVYGSLVVANRLRHVLLTILLVGLRLPVHVAIIVLLALMTLSELWEKKLVCYPITLTSEQVAELKILPKTITKCVRYSGLRRLITFGRL